MFLLLAMAALGSGASGQERAVLAGTVVDTTGAPIQGAQIEYRSAAGITMTGSDVQGHFRLEGAEAGGVLVVSLPGFATVTREIRVRAATDNLLIVLAPAANLQRIEVRASAGDRIPAVPTSQYEISSETIQISGSLAVDDVLRQVPGFSTFRRSSRQACAA